MLVDAGAFTGSQQGTWEARSLFLLETMKEAGYDALTIGEPEMRLDRELLGALTSSPGANFVSANLWDTEADRRLFPTHRIVEKSGVRVGITAVTVPSPAIRPRVEAAGYRALDPVKELERVLPSLRRDADVVVLLARMPLADARQLGTRLFDQIDVIVVGSGENGRGLVHPENGGAVYLTAGNRGQAVGVARIAFDGAGEIDRITGTEVVLDRSHQEDPATAQVVDDFTRNLNAIMQEYAAQQVAERASEDGHFYLEANTCRDCHLREYEIWSETPHAHAFETLVEAGTEALPECYRCHVTGHGDPAGYHPSAEASLGLINVQCEVCHGKGSAHSRNGEWGEGLLMNGCSKCHDPDNSPDFDPDVYWRMIEH